MIQKTKERLLKHKSENDAADIESKGHEIEVIASIRLKDIVEREFNTRLHQDVMRPLATSSQGQSIESLKLSMQTSGQKTPIVVSHAPDQKFYIVAGFRRHRCAKELCWTQIRAIVLPMSLTREEEYWFNILENTTRKNLSTYEVAHAARMMRDEFNVDPSVFAKQSGYPYSHVKKLLACIDRLPDELIEQWKHEAGLSFEQWYTLSMLEPHLAIRRYRHLVGIPTQQMVKEIGAKLNARKRGSTSKKWIRRAAIIRSVVQLSNLPRAEIINALNIIDYCAGDREDVPGIYSPKNEKIYEKRIQIARRVGLDKDPIPEPIDLPPGESEDDNIPKLD